MGPIAQFQFACREYLTLSAAELLLVAKDVIAATMVEFVQLPTFVHALLVGEGTIALNQHAQ